MDSPSPDKRPEAPADKASAQAEAKKFLRRVEEIIYLLLLLLGLAAVFIIHSKCLSTPDTPPPAASTH